MKAEQVSTLPRSQIYLRYKLRDRTHIHCGGQGRLLRRILGLAFQIVDDVLDLTAAEDVLGKPVASDLREGKATLAVIHALERGTGADREAIRTVLAERSFATVSHADILEILERHGSLAYAMDTACAYAEAARLSIAELPDSDAKRALLWVPGFVTSRDR